MESIEGTSEESRIPFDNHRSPSALYLLLISVEKAIITALKDSSKGI